MDQQAGRYRTNSRGRSDEDHRHKRVAVYASAGGEEKIRLCLGSIPSPEFLPCCSAPAQQVPRLCPAAANRPSVLENVGFRPQLNAHLPLDLAFRDEAGRNVQLREYFTQKPVLLALVYYGCPMLCNQTEQGG